MLPKKDREIISNLEKASDITKQKLQVILAN